MKEMFQSESRGNLTADEILAAIYIKRVLCLICVYIYIGTHAAETSARRLAIAYRASR